MRAWQVVHSLLTHLFLSRPRTQAEAERARLVTAFVQERARLLAEREQQLQQLQQLQQQQQQQPRRRPPQQQEEEEEDWEEEGVGSGSGSGGIDPLLVEATAEEARRCVFRLCCRCCFAVVSSLHRGVFWMDDCLLHRDAIAPRSHQHPPPTHYPPQGHGPPRGRAARRGQ